MALKRILGRAWSWFKLSHKENNIDALVILYIKFVSIKIYSLFHLKSADVLLDQFFNYINKKKNEVALMKFEHSLISNLQKQKLMAFVIVLYLICKSKKYYISGINTGNVSVEQGRNQTLL